MKTKIIELQKQKANTIPILSFPATQLLGISVSDLISSADMQAKGMEAIAQRCSIGAALNMMDLSVEAEAFGTKIRFSEDDIPTVEQGVLDDISLAESLAVPAVGAGRTGLYLEGVRKAKARISHIPVFCGVIGPYSLAGRLFDMTELMMECYDSPEDVKVLLSKATSFIIDYIHAFKEAGADGVILAEPAAGLLSPALAEEFSTPYVKQIFDAVNSEDFMLCYHNCGNAAGSMLDSILTLPADIFHYGNAIDLGSVLEQTPSDKIVMGNVDPVLFRTGSCQDIREAVQTVLSEYSSYDNFMISSGCDIPAASKWENIDTYFETVRDYYAHGNHR